MPDEIYGVMAVKNGQKQTIMNLSNARQKSYADLQTMTDAQKKGVIVCPDYPKEEFLVTADEVSYGSGTVKDALDELSNTACVTGTLASSVGTSTTISYPTGFDGSNCIVIGAMYEYATNTYAQYDHNGTQRFDVFLNPSNMSITPRDSGAVSKNVKIILQKFA
jgi:hypothetical protein